MTESGLAERLERGEVLFYPVSPFPIPDTGERTFLAQQQLAGKVHKNISFDPLTGKMNGFLRQSDDNTQRLHKVLSSFSNSVTQWLSEQFPSYARHWELDRVSYRPLEEATRNLRLRARNDLLHVDAFPTRPTNGWRILRVFVNVNLTEPRVWVTSDPFGRLLERYGKEAGLPTRGFTMSKAIQMLRDVPQLFRPGRRPRSEYDAFMLRFHHFLKANEQFQEHCVKRVWSFPASSVWLAMTDTASHAVLRGRFALEHSFFISPGSLALPEESPPALLARACGLPVLAAA
jgi:3-deoxy-D-manno-oct-2-ulosonic acid (Kdo) hydroxylase